MKEAKGSSVNGVTAAYEPTAVSLQTHSVPDWFLDAKFGVFIHWGPYSIPAFAPHNVSMDQLEAAGEASGFANTPYAEWYQNTMQFEGGATAKYHAETFGPDYPYERFGEAFNASLEAWDPVSWAQLFKRSGAGYVVLVTKHHDGFALWPSDVENPNRKGWHTTRDVVGELAAAVRAEGLKFGVYYSGGVDWTFKHKRIESFADFMTSMPGEAEGYTAYANAQYEELIERYKPDYLWNDIAYPSAQSSFDIIAKYYNTVPEGLTNDRWMTPDGTLPEGAFDKPEGLTGLLPPMPEVWDVRTPEYGMFDRILPFLWETTRGMGHSFAYNRNETEADYITRDGIVGMLARSACFNGNVLLNVGPRGDTVIPPGQAARLEGAGAWLERVGPAIRGTRPVALPDREAGGLPIGGTRRDGWLYLHVFGVPETATLSIRLPETAGAVANVTQAGGEISDWSVTEGTLTLKVPDWADTAVQSFCLEIQGNEETAG
jgi:alpha-L-fucosidase